MNQFVTGHSDQHAGRAVHAGMAASPAHQVLPPGAQAPAEPAPPWHQRATTRTAFAALLAVELRKLAGTLSDRILLFSGPLVIVGLGVLACWVFADDGYYDVASQIMPTVWIMQVSGAVLHAALIKLIAGEWHFRSAQPTLLIQPSRRRYFATQACVVLIMWLVCTGLQLATTMVAMPIFVDAQGSGYLLGHRIGWVVGVVALSSFMTILIALVVSMLIPNPAGALAVYCVSVPAMLVLFGLLPEVFAWLAPLSPVAAVADISLVEHAAPPIAAVFLWLTLLLLSIRRVARRDLA